MWDYVGPAHCTCDILLCIVACLSVCLYTCAFLNGYGAGIVITCVCVCLCMCPSVRNLRTSWWMSTKLFRYASRNVLLLVFIRFRVWIQDHFSTFLNFPFFACRVVKMWNSLPVDIVDFSSLSRFRRSLCKIDFSDFLTVQYFFFLFLNLYCL